MIRADAARLCRKALPICNSIGDISQNPLEFEGSSSLRSAARGLAPRMRGRYHFDLKARLATRQARLDGLAQALGAGIHDCNGIDASDARARWPEGRLRAAWAEVRADPEDAEMAEPTCPAHLAADAAGTTIGEQGVRT